ncbi:MAG: FkbM family methyltransferase [Dysgonamonadaceae bacterium]|jgi:hypothetical protein|nr:FkbM family methyltransferase [Dysgonamonadaceae bacterium]
MLVKWYRKYVPEKTRDSIYNAFLGAVLDFFRYFCLRERLKVIVIYWFQCFLPDTDENRRFAFMGRYGITHYPYPFSLEYYRLPVDCLFDEQYQLPYIIHSGKKLYFPKSYQKRLITFAYRNLRTEQDARSPHLYVKDMNRLKGKTVLDIGAAEAIFSLDAIELIHQAYIFECDENWIEALNATFAPWKEKVTIVRKYVGEVDDDNNITLDHFLEGKDKTHLFLKMDIEGYEQAALKGAHNTLQEVHDLDFSICTYHRKNDAVEIADILRSYHFEYEQTEGYVYFEKEFRKGIIRRKI